MTRPVPWLVVALGVFASAWFAGASLPARVALAAQAQPAPLRPADLVLTNGKIVTVDDQVPEAQAMP